MSNPIIRPLAAGALLTLGCVGRPAPSEAQPTDPAPPSKVDAAPPSPPTDRLPTWEETHPTRLGTPGDPAMPPPPPPTNPPTPVLLVGPDGTCYAASRDARRAPDLRWRELGDQVPRTYLVEEPDALSGQPIQCPDHVAALLDGAREP